MNYPLGFLVNPIAGTGGRVGHKGSDDPSLRAMAIQEGATPNAQIRASMTAELLADLEGVELATWGKSMGSDWLRLHQVPHKVLGEPKELETSSHDTMRAARRLTEAGVKLIMFIGGDGTARDLHDAIGEAVPVVGVPAGVKMYSGVFSSHPRMAVKSVRRFVETGGELVRAEIIDLDETALRAGTISTRLYGYLNVPHDTGITQGMKSPSPPTDHQAISEIAEHVAGKTHPDSVVVLGPGSTVEAIGQALGVRPTLLGVDVISGREVLVADGSEASLLESMRTKPVDRVIVSPIGGQGFLIGRGNQQLSPRVLRQIGLEKLEVVATPAKLKALGGRPLLVDSGDEGLDAELAGWARIIVGRDEVAVYPVHPAGQIAR